MQLSGVEATRVVHYRDYPLSSSCYASLTRRLLFVLAYNTVACAVYIQLYCITSLSIYLLVKK